MQELKIADPAPGACGGCTRCPSGAFERAGMDTRGADAVIALAGNPNTGKSTVFNALTGLRQRVGNWPGKTVVRAEGAFQAGGTKFRLVDLPGTYSLLSNSPDEEIARDFLLFGQPDVTVVVVDATALERNLNLVLQVLEITPRVVVALNLMDEAERNGLKIDHRSLARDLGVPVVPMAARQGKGITELTSTVVGVLDGEIACAPHRVLRYDEDTENAIAEISEALLAEYPNLPNAHWVALRLLEGDASIQRELDEGTLGRISHPAEGMPEARDA
ncbi:MAG: 50S ribosome-binding GTPase [Fimbriimonadaceae bacterium]|nr:50S ribosome-binding GTPase [Fimbriimonadaceae bacterium]